MELRGRKTGETDLGSLNSLRQYFYLYCIDHPLAYAYIEIVIKALADKHHEVQSTIKRHRDVKVKEAKENKESALVFLDSEYFDLYLMNAGLSPSWARKIIKEFERNLKYKKLKKNVARQRLIKVTKKRGSKCRKRKC